MVEKSNLHATAVSFEGKGLLILGVSGSGKSDLALRIIDQGGVLVADDRCELLSNQSGRLIVSAPSQLQGLLEVRGLGIVNLPFATDLAVDLVIALESEPSTVQRMPEQQYETLLNVRVPKISIWPFAASAVTVIKLALTAHPV
jgi:HPr kinase/phosphorylase